MNLQPLRQMAEEMLICSPAIAIDLAGEERINDLAEALLRALDALERCREQREMNYNGLNQNFHAERDDEELSSILFPQEEK